MAARPERLRLTPGSSGQIATSLEGPHHGSADQEAPPMPYAKDAPRSDQRPTAGMSDSTPGGSFEAKGSTT